MKLRTNGFPGLVVFLFAVLAFDAAAEEKRAVTPDELVDIRVVNNVQISPDGKRVAFVVTERANPKKPKEPRNTNIWVVPSDGSEAERPFVTSTKADNSPRWSPDGRFLAFLSDRGEPIGEEEKAKNQIYLIRTDGGEAAHLTEMEGGVQNFRWSRDGSMIAFTVTDPLTEEERKKRKDGYDEIHVDHNYKYARLWVVTLSDRKAELVTKQDLHVSEFDWSPDGSELALMVSSTPQLDDVYWHSSLVVIRRLTGELVHTLSARATGANLKWSPDGRTITFREFTPNRIAVWLALMPARGGSARYLLKDYRGTVLGVKWTPDSKHFVAGGLEGTLGKLLRIDTTTGTFSKLTDLTPVRREGFSISADGRNIAYLKGAGNAPRDVWILTQDQSPRKLTDIHPQVSSLRLGKVKEVTWKSKKDGRTIYGVLITPPDFKPGQSYPTVVQVHGGPMGAWWTGWLGGAQLLASNGYVVFLPNPRGSTGQGWQFAEANRDDWGGGDFQDIMDGVDYLIEQEIADPDRLGIGGWSYGGFMTSWAVTQTDRFKAAVVGAAVTNLLSFNGTTDITPSFLRSYFLDIPFRRRAAYDNHSPMTFLQNSKTPSLVLHGQADKRVPVSQGWEFYNGLKALGVETEMVVYPREPHGLRERAHQVDLLKRILGWYDRHLKK